MARKTNKWIADFLRIDERTAGAVRRALEDKSADAEERLRRVNDLTEGFGVEAIMPADGSSDDEPLALYVNYGDTYKATIVYDVEQLRFKWTTWGDWIECAERNKRLVP